MKNGFTPAKARCIDLPRGGVFYSVVIQRRHRRPSPKAPLPTVVSGTRFHQFGGSPSLRDSVNRQLALLARAQKFIIFRLNGSPLWASETLACALNPIER